MRFDSEAVPFHMPFIRFTEKVSLESRLVAIMVRYADLRDETLTAHSLNHIALLRPLDRRYLLKNSNTV